MPSAPHYLYQELYERLKTDENLFSWFEQGATDGLWYWDLLNPEQEWLSPRFKEVFGYEEDEIPHTSEWWQKNIFPEDLPAVLDNFEKHKADPDHPYDQVVRYRHKTGKTIWVRCRGLIIRDEHGEASRMLGAHTDVTAVMESLQRQQQSENQLTSAIKELNEINSLALSSSEVGTWYWDMNTNTIFWDPTMYALYDIDQSGDRLNIDDWWSRVHPDECERLQLKIQAALEGAPYKEVFRVIHRNGKTRYLKATATVYFNDTGAPTHMRGANWDITEEISRQQELERSNQDLSTFAYIASHDLKAPLRGIRQLASWIEEDLPDVPDSVAGHIDLMKGRISRLESLLDDILAYSRAGRLPEEKTREVVDSHQLISEIWDVLSPPPDAQLILKGGFPTLSTHKSLLEQVIMNLLSNAIKHRDSTPCTVTVWSEPAAEANMHRFHIADANPVIAEKYHDRIFQMFQTLRPRDEVEGSGMGLAITKKQVEGKGGQLTLQIHPQTSAGIHNEFTFTWPDEPQSC
ncbi:MAG: PAS domain-containing protein [Thalassolituus sp.]